MSGPFFITPLAAVAQADFQRMRAKDVRDARLLAKRHGEQLQKLAARAAARLARRADPTGAHS